LALHQGRTPYSISPVYFIATPQVMALIMAFLPLGATLSCLAWGVLSAAMLALSVALTADTLHWRPPLGTIAVGGWLLAVYVPAVLMTLAYVQISAPVVLSYAAALWLFARGDEGRAGAALSVSLLIKPQLAFLCLPLLLYKRRWRATLTYLGTLAAVSLLALAAVGPHTFADFATTQRTLLDWTAHGNGLQFEVPGIRDLFMSVWPHVPGATPITALLDLVLLGLLAYYWRGPWQPATPRFAAGWCMGIIVTMLISNYCHYYDAVLLFLPMVVLAAEAGRPRNSGTSARRLLLAGLAALYLAPDLHELYRLHLMVPALLLACGALWRGVQPASDSAVSSAAPATAVSDLTVNGHGKDDTLKGPDGRPDIPAPT
jgi:hypothetical protein